ncbi:MAG: endonuclease/exonuclease/phosphatase family protein [Ignavibacteria bacterium]|nr:MAG: endonuclease/exonuclease/phosphatase family protein [Ignavibacteria bacterium]
MQSQQMRIITFNIKYDNAEDTVNNWNDRKEELIQLLKYYNPDIFGVQEALANQMNYIDSSLDNYSFIGCGRDDGKTKGEYSAIFFNKDKFEVISDSTIWLSETMDTGSVGWDAAITRVCTFGLFKHIASGKFFRVFNTHFDHIGKEARVNSAKLILKTIKEVNVDNLPVILTGDFNATPEEEPIKLLSFTLNQSKSVSKTLPYGPDFTFNGFNNKPGNKRIDYIFTKRFSVLNYRVIDDRRNNYKFISDHFPVMTTIRF